MRKFLKEKDEHIEKTGPKELLWFAGLWVLGFLALTALGLAIKLFLKP